MFQTEVLCKSCILCACGIPYEFVHNVPYFSIFVLFSQQNFRFEYSDLECPFCIRQFKEELIKNTLSIFKKEEFKIEVTSQKAIRQLQEKLNRQEAQEKWDPRPERKSVINRTKNEIMKTREDYEREMRKVRNGSTIHFRIELFQAYIGI